MTTPAESPASTPTLLNDHDLRALVQKDSDARLQAEIRKGQSSFDDNYVVTLTRDELVSYVVKLRKFAKQNKAVTFLVQEFEDYCESIKLNLKANTEANPISTVNNPPAEWMNIMTMMLQQKQRGRRER